MYTSTLFAGRRRAVESNCDTWYILSAKHGLLLPTQIIEPYDVRMMSLSTAEKKTWSQGVIAALERQIGDLSHHTFEIHAGHSYRHPILVEGLVRLGATVEEPLANLTFGEQLHAYGEGLPRAGGHQSQHPRVRRSKYAAFEEFLRANDAEVVTLDFGAIEQILGFSLPPSARRHREWWANSASMPQGRSWLDAGWRISRVDLDSGEAAFTTSAQYRAKENSRFSAAPGGNRDDSTVTPCRESGEVLDDERALAVAHALLLHSERIRSGRDDPQVSFTDNTKANQLLRDDSFAFLVAVIADQGIKAERAWILPWVVLERIGHLSPRRLIEDPEPLFAAFHERPMPHRLKDTVPGWILSAARRVEDRYGGAAAAIWNDNPSAVALQERLVLFDGIGQKKAAMAVEILSREMGVNVVALEGSDVAFDVHVRRVFLRAGLVASDDRDAVIRRARALHPERPGALDLPAWDVGRKWCRPATPLCPSCVLGSVCPQFIASASGVRGV